jgi:hypothetical protein
MKLMCREKNPAVFILSAGPFYFLSACLFKPSRHKLIFDLRDPFLGDSKNVVSSFKIALKRIFQNWFLKQPDAIITINEFLRINFGIPEKFPHIIVPNGFENSLHSKSSRNKKILISGKVYGDISTFIEQMLALDSEIEFHQYVDKESSLPCNFIAGRERVFVHDSVAVQDVAAICEQFSIGLVSSYPEDFVLPVKIFDYMNFQQKLIVINDKNVEKTEIKVLLKDYPHVLYFYHNIVQTEEFTKFINAPQPNFEVTIPSQFYRQHSTESLAQFIQKTFFKEVTNL